MKTEFRASGDRSLLAVYGSGVDQAANEKVRQMAALLSGRSHPGIEAAVGSYCTLMLHYNPLHIGFEELTRHLLDLEKTLGEVVVEGAKTVEIPVCYGGEFGPDLSFVAQHAGMGTNEVIALHSAVSYHIYAIGFAPGFCYLGGLDPRLHAPRLMTPRQNVPAGSVGIAASQTGVYPLASPGGWQLIGRTPLRLFAPERQQPILYQPGDSIRFRPVAEDEFRHIYQLDNP
ncbi:MAG: 5-oxoprolinase subunit PxpB [Desulforhopalus sp.]|nr:5-oxoprolinase subunit PxpB [Desulforhopalus sp.]